MNYLASTQRNHWKSLCRDDGSWRSAQEQTIFRDCIWFLHELHPKCGLGPQRKAFVTAAHYFHRYFSVRSVEEESANPRLAAMACLFIAGKTEEVPWPKYSHGSLQMRGFTARKLCEAADDEVTIEELTEREREVLELLGFTLIVHQSKPRPAPGSDDEMRETLLLMSTRDCLTKTPEEFGEALKHITLTEFGFPSVQPHME